jgi:hypothetical protein
LLEQNALSFFPYFSLCFFYTPSCIVLIIPLFM